jgi:hypothetical protein
MSEEAGTRLLALVDGVALPEEEGKALWREFSEHMDANRGDMAGFAKLKGWVSVAPEYRGGKAVLVVKTTAAKPQPAKAKGPVVKPKGKAFVPRPQGPPKGGGQPAKLTRARRRG